MRLLLSGRGGGGKPWRFVSGLMAALVIGLSLFSVASAQEPQYQPPHKQPGPAVDTLRFRAFHMDIAPAEVRAGNMDLYYFGLKTEAAKGLAATPGVRLYQAPATMLSLLLNPAPAPQGQLNPFSLREVRFALQYVVNRELVAQEVFKGLAKPMLSLVSPVDFDYLTVYDLLRGYNIAYDPQLARDMVTKAMTQAGAVLQDGVWHYSGKPIRLKFVIRVEDERRHIGDLIRVELEKLGFQVSPAYHMFAPAILTVYGTDPQLFEWHLYTEGWSRGAAERYDSTSINQMAAPWLGNMPGWQEVGYWQYQNPRLDELGQRLFQGSFTSLEERNQLYREATRLSLEESVRIWVATVINTFPANDRLQGVTEDVAAGPKSMWTLRTAYLPDKKELTVGSLWVWTERTTWNPVGGFGDVYSADIWGQVYDPPLARHPFTGLPMPFRTTYQVVTAGPQGKLEVPSDAFRWDAVGGGFRAVGQGVQATSKVTFDFAKYFQSTWHHGQPITMADVIYSIFQSFDIAYNKDKSQIEFSLATTRRPYLSLFQGFRLVGETKIEVYVNYWHFIPDYIAEYANLTGLSMPWEILAAMDQLVFQERRAAYSDTAAQRFGVPWLSLVMDKDARLVRRTLRQFLDEGFVPQNAFQVGGKALVGREEAQQRYRAALAWFDQYGLLVISNGPFQLVRFDPTAQFAELKAFREATYPFKPGDWYFGGTARVDFARVEAPPIRIQSTASVEVELRGPGQLGLRYLLFDPATGQSLSGGEAKPLTSTKFAITLSQEETAKLKPGFYQLFLVGYSDAVSSPVERRLDVEATFSQAGVELKSPTPKAATPGPKVASEAEAGLSGATIVLIGLVVAAMAVALGMLFWMRRRRGN